METRVKTAMAVAMVLLSILAGSQAGAVELRFEPQSQNIELDEEGSLSIWLDEPLEIRTIEVTISYNGELLEEMGGGAGAAFLDLPCYTWEEYTPGDNQFYGFAVTMGADCFVTGPGELFRWDFRGVSAGTAYINTVTVGLYDRYAETIEEVVLEGTSVVVGDPMVPVPMTGQPVISAIPNPCNPMTTIKFWLPSSGTGHLDVFDLKGRRVRRLIDGPIAQEWTSVRWDGRTDSGQAAPSGIYLYRLIAGKELLTGRVTLAR